MGSNCLPQDLEFSPSISQLRGISRRNVRKILFSQAFEGFIQLRAQGLIIGRKHSYVFVLRLVELVSGKRSHESDKSVSWMKSLEFRLYSEGSNKHPYWGIAFRHRADVRKVFDIDPQERSKSIQVEFPNSEVCTFGIRPSFWNKCHELVDSRVYEHTKPVKAFAVDGLGYSVKTKGKCIIEVKVVKRNKLLRITSFE